MAIRENAFSQEKCLEALLLIAAKLPHSSTVLDLLRVTYLADKCHLSEYGFLASRDEYVATPDGALAQGTFRVLSRVWDQIDASGTDRRFASLVKGSLLAELGGKSRVKAVRQPDFSFLSEADIECIRRAVAEYIDMPASQRALAAKDAAWEKAWEGRPEAASSVAIPVEAIAETLDNASEVLAYLDA